MSASRTLPLPGRRGPRQQAAGERVAGLFEEHGRMVYGVCRLILRDPIEAEDAAQQAFLSAYRGLLAGQQPREPSAWLGTIARNECRSRLRARRTEPLTLVTTASADDTQRDAGRRAEIEALCLALAELPQHQRDAIVLREFYGLSYAEVAGALGLSGAAVESLLFRSRKRLQEQLRPLRSALGVLTLPLTLRDSLAEALPGFGGAGASAGAGAVLFGKVGSVPLAAKLAAATLAVGTAGTIAGVESHGLQRRSHAGPKHAPAAHEVASARAARPEPVTNVSFAPAAAPKPTQEAPSDRQESGDGHSGRSSGDERTRVETRGEIDRSGPNGHEQEAEVEPVATSQLVHGDGGGSGSGEGSGDHASGGSDGSGSSGGDSGSGSVDSSH